MLLIMENNLNIQNEEGTIEEEKFVPIRSTSYDQHDIIRDIQELYVPGGFDLDPTYSKGVFYKPDNIIQPRLKFDLFPKTEDTIQASAENLPLKRKSVKSIMFDPPFIAGHTRKKVDSTGVFGDRCQTGIFGKRFSGFRYVSDLWGWYDECLAEFNRVLEDEGILVFKCQDTCSSSKNWFSHCFIMNRALVHGFYPRDMFVLLAKHRIAGHNHRKKQSHASKFHSYFWVFEKKECKVPYDIYDVLRTNQASDKLTAKKEEKKKRQALLLQPFFEFLQAISQQKEKEENG